MWEDIFNIDERCREKFLTEQEFPEFAQHHWRMAGVSWLRGTYVVGRKLPDVHTLVFTVDGQGKLYLPNQQHGVQAGELMFMPAGQPFRFEIDGAEWKTCWILLPDNERWRFLNTRRAGVQPTDACWSLYHLLHGLYHQMHSSRRRRLTQMVTELVSEEVTQDAQRDITHERLLRLFQQLEDRLHVPWSLEALAAELHYSPSHFHRLCRQYFHQGPMQKVAAMRLARARELLQYSEWQIRQIAQRVGYQDAFNFTHWFRRQTGLSPSDYRAACRAQTGVAEQ